MPAATVTTECHRCGESQADLIQVNMSAFMEADPLRADRYLEETHYKTLCTPCRDDVEGMLLQAEKEVHLPARLTEGLHFYKEGPLMVFTEYYHILKGYCCQNRCRHCAYGLKSEV